MNNMYSDQDILVNIPQLIAYYRQKVEDNSTLKAGIEWERFGVYEDTLKPVAYDDPDGYQSIMRFLQEKKGWIVDEEDTEKNLIFSLSRNISAITIEGDGKPEITTAPFPSLHTVAREIKQHKDEIDHKAKESGITWIAMGLHPFTHPNEIPVIPKKRYSLFQKMHPNHEEWIQMYITGVCGTHLNFGYTSEENMIQKLQVLYRLTPILIAMFSNSPFIYGELGEYPNMRRVKMFQDPPSCVSLVPGILKKDFSLEKWINWYVDTKMILFPYDQNIEPPENFTFRDWMNKGYEGVFPTIADFDQHVKTNWGDIRLRPYYLEHRALDALPYALLMAATAFVKGLVFDRKGWWAVEKITNKWDEETIRELINRVPKEGIQMKVDGVSFLDMTRELYDVSAQNLSEFDRQNEKGEDERVFLKPLQYLLDEGRSVADDIIADTKGEKRKILEWIRKDFSEK